MGIVIIPNQVIRFRTTSEIDDSCECLGRSFSQLINKNDDSMFQLSSSNEVTNGDFESDLTGWDVYTAITGTTVTVNESAEDECDGEVTVTGSGGSAPYAYTMDGINYGTTFTGLCAGDYVVYIYDNLGHIGSVEFTIYTNVACGDYEGFTLQQMIDSEITLGQLYNCTLDDIKP